MLETFADNAVLASKFAVPAAPPFMVERPALCDRLTEGVRGPVTLVTGVAGGGKTQLLASWVRGRPVDWPIAWITVESDDAFWVYLVEGLRRAGVPVPELVPSAAGVGAGRALLTRLAGVLAAQPTPVVLILDGVSQLPGDRWATGLEFLLEHTDNLRVVLAGRWDPPLPLHRYRLAGRLREVRTADLAFTEAETTRLLDLHGVALAEPRLRALLAHTEGWAAGIRLCACALQASDDAESLIATITGDESTIAEYFSAEVLRLQPPEVRRFLLETSVLDTFTPELAAAVTGRFDASRLLSGLTRENAFVQSVGEGAHVYRYHRLFAELLQAQLAWAEPDRVAELHQRAAAWLAEHGRVEEAVEHAVRAKDWSTAATMVIEDYAVARLVIEGSAGRLGRLFAGLPQHLAHPETVVVRAAIAYGDGDRLRAAEQLAYAGKLLSLHGSACGDGLTLACFLMRVLLVRGADPQRLDDLVPVARTFLSVAPADRLARHPELPALLRAAEGMAHSDVGMVDRAMEALTDAASLTPAGSESLRVDCLKHLALLEAHRGRLGRAETYAQQALDLAAQCGLAGPGAAEAALAWVALERYDVEAADRHLRAAHPLCGAAGDPLAAAAYTLVKARRLQTRGEQRAALTTLAAGAVPEAPAWLRSAIVLGHCRLLIGSGQVSEAAAILAPYPLPRPAEVAVVDAALAHARGDAIRAHEVARTVADAARVPAPVAIEAWLLLAVLAADADDAGAAREALRRAMRVAAPDGHRRPMHLVRAQLRRVLRADEQFHWLGAEPVAEGPAAAPPAVVEPLSRRELDVLRGMAEMLPTEEIAARMYVSVNTVKTHVRSILRKLSASRRNEAVRRARQLNLI
ncbi:transcriptional regulator [Paractinoplanes deccanensis]|uniref:Transcriptional regulator n=1 Tax=Paractinoplanes deccanensis TaxID=113561 RepID=A0ABQ3YHF3_9ACTN|nr:LuxR C-terminal-related transcriptional regulator [Actinoplanes deccanensis]GID79345.1 transcriptional regulator [Actinoplanes deccanensis]